MAGDPNNASLWADADVYVGDPATSVLPATGGDPFDASWDLVGLLDGDEGYTTGREWGGNDDFYAWGGLLVRTSRRQFKLTKKFTALEDNATTRALVWPGSAAGEISVPKIGQIWLAFELREGTTVKRAITRNYAEVDVDGDVKEGEADLTKFPLIATIYPDANGVLFDTTEVTS